MFYGVSAKSVVLRNDKNENFNVCKAFFLNATFVCTSTRAYMIFGTLLDMRNVQCGSEFFDDNRGNLVCSGPSCTSQESLVVKYEEE